MGRRERTRKTGEAGTHAAILFFKEDTTMVEKAHGKSLCLNLFNTTYSVVHILRTCILSSLLYFAL